MSWSVSQSGVVISDVVLDRLEQLAVDSAKASNPDGADQAHLAARVVGEILNKGVVGDTTKKYVVSISGHGNPNHEPKAGWSNDMINISISQQVDP